MKKTTITLIMISVYSSLSVAENCKKINYQNGEVITVNSSSNLGTRIELPSPLSSLPMITNSQHWDVLGKPGSKNIVVAPLNNKKGGESTMIFAFTNDGKSIDIRADRVLTNKKNDPCVIIGNKVKVGLASEYMVIESKTANVYPRNEDMIKEVILELQSKLHSDKKDRNGSIKKHVNKHSVNEQLKAKKITPQPKGKVQEQKNTFQHEEKSQKIEINSHAQTNANRIITSGSFKENMTQLIKRNGYKHIMWDSSVNNCDWKQETDYVIPSIMETPEDIISFYAQTQNFYPKFSSVDKHVLLTYRGNPETLSLCEE